MSTIIMSIVCSAIVSVVICVVSAGILCRMIKKRFDKAHKEFIRAAVLVLQKFCDTFYLDDEKTKSALDNLLKQTER